MNRGKVTVVGSYLSPYVRKVLVCLGLKDIAYEIDPIIPFFGNDEFSRISPLRRVPVLIDDMVTLSDSSVICAYLDERYPDPPLLPIAPADRARARWLEEFADTRIGDVIIWRLYNQLVIKRLIWREPTDESIVRETIDVEIPQILDYLEGELPEEGCLFGDIGLADIAIAAFFRNALFAQYTIDAVRWPVTAAFVDRVLDHPPFAGLRGYEELQLKTEVPKRRDALRAAGAPITTETYGSKTARAGFFRI